MRHQGKSRKFLHEGALPCEDALNGELGKVGLPLAMGANVAMRATGGAFSSIGVTWLLRKGGSSVACMLIRASAMVMLWSHGRCPWVRMVE